MNLDPAVEEWRQRALEANRTGVGVVFAVLHKECGRAIPRVGSSGAMLPGRMCECGERLPAAAAVELPRLHGLGELLDAGMVERVKGAYPHPVRD